MRVAHGEKDGRPGRRSSCQANLSNPLLPFEMPYFFVATNSWLLAELAGQCQGETFFCRPPGQRSRRADPSWCAVNQNDSFKCIERG